jgi:hypothetical protein
MNKGQDPKIIADLIGHHDEIASFCVVGRLAKFGTKAPGSGSFVYDMDLEPISD